MTPASTPEHTRPPLQMPGGEAEPADPAGVPPRMIDSNALFDPDAAIYIRHAGDLYCLQLTRLNKLILTK